MADFITDIKNSFNRGSISLQFIYINIGVFILTTLVSVFLMLFNWRMGGWLEWLELPAWMSQFVRQPWSLLTYMFLHAHDVIYCLICSGCTGSGNCF